MKKFLFKLFLLSPIVIGVTLINFCVDPAHLFHAYAHKPYEYEKKIADILLKGNNVTNISDYNERVVQKDYIEGQKDIKDVVVIGSSRSMAIRSRLFPEKLFMNNSVSGAMIQDYLGIYELYRKEGRVPKEIVLGVDPWIFNKNYSESRWKALEKEYKELLSVLNASELKMNYKINDFISDNILELFSLSYFQTAWSKLRSKNIEESENFVEEPLATKETFNEKATILVDGSRVYDKLSREKSAHEVAILAESSVTQKTSYGFDSFYEIDHRMRVNFEKFVALLKKDGVKVTLYLPPYHFRSYEVMDKTPKYKMVKDVEQYLKNFARDNDIKLVGSYDPKHLHVNEDEFLDGMHLKDTAVNKIFQ
jgi:hypothetical protein